MEFLRKITALLLIGGSCFLNLNAQNTDWATKQRNIQNFALTLSSGEDSLSYSYFSLGVTGHYNQLKGLGINLLANHSNRDMAGMMLSGMVNIAGRNSQGMAIAGIANVSGKQMNGMSIGGLMNVSGSSMNGMQISGIGNISGTAFNGITAGGLINLSGTNSNGIILSGIANITGQDLNGIALSGLMNVAGKDANGVQISGLSNITAGKLQGLQAAALLNIATQNNGLQIGAVNVAEKIKGLQIGLVNYSRDTTGHKIGLVNLTPATRYQLMVMAEIAVSSTLRHDSRIAILTPFWVPEPITLTLTRNFRQTYSTEPVYGFLWLKDGKSVRTEVTYILKHSKTITLKFQKECMPCRHV